LSYCALRHHYEPEEAYANLGVYGGDDGVTFDIPPNTILLTTAKFGMSFDAEAIDKGNPVPFLGRIYLDPWTSVESVCDVLRQFRKLHLTATPKIVPDALVLHRKAMGILATDSNTPIITCWAETVERLVKRIYRPLQLGISSNYRIVNDRQYAATLVDRSYWSKYESDVQFVPPDDYDFARVVVCNNLGITIEEMEKIEDNFRSANTLEDLYKTDLIHTDMKVLIDAIVGRELVYAQPRKTIPTLIKENAKLKIALCRFTAKNLPCKFGDKCKFSHHVPKANAKNSKPKMNFKKKQ
jgi:hypothetical protein